MCLFCWDLPSFSLLLREEVIEIEALAQGFSLAFLFWGGGGPRPRGATEGQVCNNRCRQANTMNMAWC